MKSNHSRRSFVRNAFLASSGLSLIPTSILATEQKANTCTSRIDTRTLSFTKYLKLNGQVWDIPGLKGAANVAITLYIGGKFEESKPEVIHLKTDENGRFEVRSDMARKNPGRCARVGLELGTVSDKNYSELVIGKDRVLFDHRHWEQHHCLNDRLHPQFKESLFSKNITFQLTNKQ